MTRLRRSLALVAACAAQMAMTARHDLQAAAPVTSLRVAALSNDAFPGLPVGVEFDRFLTVAVHGDGLVALRAFLSQGVGGTTSADDVAFWLETRPGVLDFVAREGDELAGSGYRFLEPSLASKPVAGSDGGLFLSAGLVNNSNPADSSSGIFRYSPASGLAPVVLSSPVVPGVPTVGAPGDFINVDFDVNDGGEIALQTGGGFGTTWSVTDTAGVTQVDLGGGTRVRINDRGQVVFRDRVTFPETSVVVWDPQTLGTRIVATEGEPAPGAGDATFGINRLANFLSNDPGPVSFVGGLIGVGVDSTNDFGIWSEETEGGPLRLDLREGDPAVGLSPDLVWADFSFNTFVNYGVDGGIALELGLSGPGVTSANDSGVWAGPSASQLHLVAREGDPAPGVEDGLAFGLITQTGAFPDGRGVFAAFLTGPGLDPARDRGIWAEDANGALRLIARRGDPLTLPSGEVVDMTSVSLNPGSGLGELGHLGLLANLSNGQQAVLVSDAVVIPEASGAALVGLVFAMSASANHRVARRSA